MDLLKSRRGFIICFLLMSGLSSMVRKDIQEAEIQLEYMYIYYNSSFYEVIGMFDGELVDVYRKGMTSPIPKKEWNNKEGTFSTTSWNEIVLGRSFIDEVVFPLYAEKIQNRAQYSTGEAAIVQMNLGCISKGSKGQQRSFAELAYNGETVFYYDQRSLVDHRHKDVWVPIQHADHDVHGEFIAQILNSDKPDNWTKYRDNLSNFININCLTALSQFKENEKSNKSGVPRVSSMGRVGPGRRNLSCLVTGFYPKSLPLQGRWFRNDIVLTEGVWSSGVRPNDDHTYQIRYGVEVTDVQSEVYRCEVNLPGDFTKRCTWGPTPTEPKHDRSDTSTPSAKWVVVMVVVMVFVLVVVVLFLVV